jgi:hypothetical protein
LSIDPSEAEEMKTQLRVWLVVILALSLITPEGYVDLSFKTSKIKPNCFERLLELKVNKNDYRKQIEI